MTARSSPPTPWSGTSTSSSRTTAPQFDQRQSAQGRSRIPAVTSYKAVDKYTLEIITKAPDATLPYQTRLDHDVVAGAVGEARQELGRVRQDAVRHRPVEARRCSRRASAPKWCPTRTTGTRRACRSSTSWCCCRCRRPTRASRRCAAGQVDWIEAPPPDAVPSLEEGRLQDRHQRLSAQLDLASLARRRARPGTTSACARPPTSRSTATA